MFDFQFFILLERVRNKLLWNNPLKTFPLRYVAINFRRMNICGVSIKLKTYIAGRIKYSHVLTA